jgi:hypothetical protein
MNSVRCFHEKIKLKSLSALFCLVPACSDSNLNFSLDANADSKPDTKPNIFRFASTGANWLDGECNFSVLDNSDHSISISIGGIVNCPVNGTVKESAVLTIPGDTVGDYENSATWGERSGNSGYFHSAPNAFSARISYIDPHFISGGFYGTICSSVPAYCSDVTNGEFQLNY